MRRFIVIAILVVLLATVLFVARHRQVWIGHEKIHQNSLSYAGEFSSLEACRHEVEKYGGYCSSRCRWVDNVRWDDCKLTVTIAVK
jgi:hypothetical protein